MAKGEFAGKERVIAPLYFLLGAFSLVFQTILLREFFTVAAGNEISFGIALAGWLLGVGAGSFCGRIFQLPADARGRRLSLGDHAHVRRRPAAAGRRPLFAADRPCRPRGR